MNIYVEYLVFIFCILILLWLGGTAFKKISRLTFSTIYIDIFVRFFVGLSLAVIITSIYFTKGRTVNSGLLICVAALAFFHFRNNKVADTKEKFQEVNSKTLFVWLFSGLLVLYCLRVCQIYNAGGIPFLPNTDTLFHANISTFMGNTGLESISLDYLNVFPKSNTPYHYFDLWFNTAVIKVFGINALSGYILVTVTIFLFICWCGFMAVASCFTRVTPLIVIISILFLLFSGVYFPFYSRFSWLSDADVFCTNPFFYNKIVVIFLFLQISVLCFAHGKIPEGGIILLAIPLVFISTSVSVFASVFLFVVGKFAMDKNLAFALKAGTFMLVLSLFFLFFYVTGQPSQIIKIREVEGGFLTLFNYSYIKTSVNIIGLTCIQIFVLFLPFVLILIPGIKLLFSRQGPFSPGIIFFVICIFFTSLLAWAVLHYMVNTIQLFSNITSSVLAIFFFVMVVFLIDKLETIPRWVMLGVLFGFFTMKIYFIMDTSRDPYKQSEEYLLKTSEALKDINPLGIFMLNRSSYTNLFSKNPVCNVAGQHLAYMHNGAYTYSLSVFDTPVNTMDADNDRQLIASAVFYQFVQQQKEKALFRSLSQSKLDFIRLFDIDYLIAEKEVELDTSIASLISSEIIDSKTGERFYLLNNKQQSGAH